MAVSTMAVSAFSASAASYTAYRLIIKTSDVRYAGTDADVLIRAYNSNGKVIGEKSIDADGDMFDRNKTDVVTINLPEKMANLSVSVSINQLSSLKALTNTDWHLEAIRAELLSDNEAVETCVYGFNKWTGYYSTYRPLRPITTIEDYIKYLNNPLYEEKICFPTSSIMLL